MRARGVHSPQVSAVRGDLLWHSWPVRWLSYRQAPVALNSSGQQQSHRLPASGNDGADHESGCRPPSRTPARPHHYLLINVPASDHVQACISTITHRDAKTRKVYFSPVGKTDFHSLFWLPKSGRYSTEIKMSPAIKNRLFFIPFRGQSVKSDCC